MSVYDVPVSLSPVDADHRAAKWRVVEGPLDDGEFYAGPVTFAEAASHLRLTEEQGEDQASAIDLMIAAATDYAEQMMSTVLMPRVIEATFYGSERLILPRGPLLDVTSVTDANGDSAGYTIEHVGHTVRIVPTAVIVYPVTVTYRAGYPEPTKVPASIRLAILAHVASLYEQRESTSEKPLTAVPHSLADFYRLHSRSTGVG